MKTKKTKTDSLKKFVELRDALLKERAEHETRLAQINSALNDGPSAPAPAPATATAPVTRRTRLGRVAAPEVEQVETGVGVGGRRVRHRLSLRRAIILVTKDSPLTKQEILGAVKKCGYQFGVSNPMPSLNAVLYAKPKFTNVDGKFSPPA